MYPVSPVVPIADNDEIVIAENQSQYLPLPSIRTDDGTVLTRWKLTDEERTKVAEQGYIYLEILTFNQPLSPGVIQPMRLGADVPDSFELKPLKDEWPETLQ